MLHAILLLQLAAQTPQARDAELLVHDSIADYDLGYFEKALGEAEQAYRLYPLAQILFNIGQAHRALKHWEKAAYFYRRYLAKVPNAPDRPKVEGLLAEVERQAKAEQAPEAPAPQAVVMVSPPAPAAAVQPTKTESVPAAAVEAPKPPAEPSHSHATAYVLGSTAVASLIVMVIGIVYVENFQSLVGQVGSTTPPNYTTWTADQAQAQSELPHAQAWEWVAVITGTVAAATCTAAVLTW